MITKLVFQAIISVMSLDCCEGGGFLVAHLLFLSLLLSVSEHDTFQYGFKLIAFYHSFWNTSRQMYLIFLWRLFWYGPTYSSQAFKTFGNLKAVFVAWIWPLSQLSTYPKWRHWRASFALWRCHLIRPRWHIRRKNLWLSNDMDD